MIPTATQWMLLMYFAGSTQFQTIGPWQGKDSCTSTQQQVDKAFGRKVTTGCIHFDVAATPAPPPVPAPPVSTQAPKQ